MSGLDWRDWLIFYLLVSGLVACIFAQSWAHEHAGRSAGFRLAHGATMWAVSGAALVWTVGQLLWRLVAGVVRK